MSELPTSAPDSGIVDAPATPAVDATAETPSSSGGDRLSRAVRWLKDGAPINLKIRLSHVLLTVLGCYVAVLPAIVDPELAKATLRILGRDISWLWVYVPGLFVVAVGSQLANGARVLQWARFLRDHATTLASNIEALSEHHWGDSREGWSLDRLIADLLQGMVDTTTGYGSLSEAHEVSATLFVPKEIAGERYLAVFERNRLRTKRNLSPIPETDPGPAATCYRQRERIVVKDVRKWPDAQDLNRRGPRSIVAFPVQCGGALSHGVVVLDVARQDFFRERVLDEGLEPVLSPHLMLIGQAYTLHALRGR